MRRIVSHAPSNGRAAVDLRHPADCERLQRALLLAGWEASLVEAQAFWEAHSEDYCAGWLILPDEDDALLGEVKSAACSHISENGDVR